MLSFEIHATAPDCSARVGRVTTPHGAFDTPAFMPVGTCGALKGVTPAQLTDTGTQIMLSNTYHLLQRPGTEVVEQMGGIQAFSGWNGPMLTDSGGFQVFSLGLICRVGDDGVVFKSHIDGSEISLDPEGATQIQNRLGADIIMALDECPPLPSEPDRVAGAVERTIRWAERCRRAHGRTDQWQFGIVQGGLDIELRQRCASELVGMGFDGYAIGGLSVGESHDEMIATLAATTPALPTHQPRYLMGVGMPRDLLAAVLCGVDMFDCVLPTRNGRNSYAFTAQGGLKLRNLAHREADEPLEADCDCYTCRRFSRAYLRHLFIAGEMIGPTLASIHNLRFFQRFMARLRDLIREGDPARITAEYPVAAGAELDPNET